MCCILYGSLFVPIIFEIFGTKAQNLFQTGLSRDFETTNENIFVNDPQDDAARRIFVADC